MKIFGSKKATFTAVGATGTLAIAPFVAYLIKLVLPDAPDEAVLHFAEFIVGIIGAVLASYNLAQGYVDGKQAEGLVIEGEVEVAGE